MRKLPIPFSAPMVCANYDGRKSMTRRIITKPAALDAIAVFGPDFLLKPGCADLLKYAVGDHLWVREAWRTGDDVDDFSPSYIIEKRKERGLSIKYFPVFWVATEDYTNWYQWPPYEPGRYRHGMHLPMVFSRSTLIVKAIKIERLQAITPEDAIAEGLARLSKDDGRTWKYGIPDRDGIDIYGRALARLRVNGRDIGTILLREGHAIRWKPGRKAWQERADYWCGK